MKERLTGAIILVALIVLLVPELLTGPPQLGRAGPPVRATTALAGAQPAPVHSVTLPLMTGAVSRTTTIEQASAPPAQRSPAPTPVPTARGAPAPAPIPSAGAQSAAPSARDAPAPAEPPPAQPSHPKAKPAARLTARAPAKAKARPAHRAATGGHWGVQLGVFAYHVDALRLAHRVHARGVPVHITSLTLRGRRLWRVTAGPVSSRAAALKLSRRLRSLGVKGNLLRQ